MRFPQPHHRARHAGSAGTDQAQALDDVAFVVQVHIAAGGFGGGFAIVEEIGFAIDVHRHKPATADIAGFGVGHGQGKGGGNCGVDGVAAFFENLCGHFGAVLIGCGDCAAVQGDGIRRRAGRDGSRQGQGFEPHNAHSIHPFIVINCGRTLSEFGDIFKQQT